MKPNSYELRKKYMLLCREALILQRGGRPDEYDRLMAEAEDVYAQLQESLRRWKDPES